MWFEYILKLVLFGWNDYIARSIPFADSSPFPFSSQVVRSCLSRAQICPARLWPDNCSYPLCAKRSVLPCLQLHGIPHFGRLPEVHAVTRRKIIAFDELLGFGEVSHLGISGSKFKAMEIRDWLILVRPSQHLRWTCLVDFILMFVDLLLIQFPEVNHPHVWGRLSFSVCPIPDLLYPRLCRIRPREILRNKPSQILGEHPKSWSLNRLNIVKIINCVGFSSCHVCFGFFGAYTIHGPPPGFTGCRPPRSWSSTSPTSVRRIHHRW